MTEEELAAIEERVQRFLASPSFYDREEIAGFAVVAEALVDEVRRLRGLRETMHVMREGIVEVSIGDKYHNLQITVRDP